MYERELKEIKRVIEGMKGYKIVYLCLYGSQNYGLDINNETYQSDIDTKAIVIPSLNDLICNSKPISEIIELPDGQCDIKDIRMYINTLLKGNPAYIETLFSPYYLIDESFEDDFEFLRNNGEELVNALRCQFIRAIYGMMCEKYKALCYPYPAIKNKIEKYGYCGKQLHHMYRLWIMMQDYYSLKEPLSECFVIKDKTTKVNLIDMKLNKYSLDNAIKLADNVKNSAEQFKDKYLESIDEQKIDYSIKKKYLDKSHEIVYNYIVNNILEITENVDTYAHCMKYDMGCENVKAYLLKECGGNCYECSFRMV